MKGGGGGSLIPERAALEGGAVLGESIEAEGKGGLLFQDLYQVSGGGEEPNDTIEGEQSQP